MVFPFIFIILMIFIIMIIFSKIVIKINDLEFNSQKDKKINNNYKFIIKLKAFNKIPILKTIYNKKKIEDINKKLNINNKIKNIDIQKLIDEIKEDNKINTKVIKIFFKDMFEIIDINLKLELGTYDAATTAILVGFISTLVSIFFRIKIKKIKSQKFKIIPIYTNQNIININISGIFEIKVIHIISIIYILLKEKTFTKQLRFGVVKLHI